MKNDKLQSSMKTIKNTFFLSIVCAASVVSSVAHELEANEKYPGKSVKAQTRKEIVTFFSESLSGKTTTFDAGKPLKLSEVEHYRDVVWRNSSSTLAKSLFILGPINIIIITPVFLIH